MLQEWINPLRNYKIHLLIYVIYKFPPHYMDNIKLYKNLLLKENKDCIKYKEINNTFLKLCIFPKKNDDDDDDYDDEFSFSSSFANGVKLNILEISKYYSQNINWITDIKRNSSNCSLPFCSVDIYTEKDNDDDNNNNDNDIDDKFQSFLYPFWTEHLLKLTFGNFN